MSAFAGALDVATGAPPRASQTAMLAYADARRSGSRPHWYVPLFRYVLFALVPTLPLFRVHQYIAYGGTFGEYYTYGLNAYLLGLAVYWGDCLVYVVMWAAIVRLLAEMIAVPASCAAPAQAKKIRRIVETVGRVAYYGGVPALLVIRFWQDL